jgi:hypothetical protein
LQLGNDLGSNSRGLLRFFDVGTGGRRQAPTDHQLAFRPAQLEPQGEEKQKNRSCCGQRQGRAAPALPGAAFLSGGSAVHVGQIHVQRRRTDLVEQASHFLKFAGRLFACGANAQMLVQEVPLLVGKRFSDALGEQGPRPFTIHGSFSL